VVATFLMLVGFSAAIKVFVVFDCRYASIRLRVDGCRSLRRASIALSLLGGPTPVTFDVHLKDGRMVNEPIDGG
jgi:hypothetical protein